MNDRHLIGSFPYSRGDGREQVLFSMVVRGHLIEMYATMEAIRTDYE
jgi:hypothetical protein